MFSSLNFKVNLGHILLIEGPNGSGKTSLLRILTGLRAPDEGALLWDNMDIAELSSDYYHDLAYVGHMNGNKDDLSVCENLLFAQKLAVATMSVDTVLEKVGLFGYQDTPLRNLSAGQRRRLALARLLCTRKRLWILDEPFTSLDKANIELFEYHIQQHALQGGIAVMTSHHDVALPLNMVQRIELQS